MDLNSINLYRITHIENIPHILVHGVTNKKSQKANLYYKSIGDLSLIDTRNLKEVSVDNGDFTNLNAPTIVLGDFIPFYFGVKMPMLYVMQKGGNFVERATPPEDIIYLVCSLNKIIRSSNVFYFCDGHATDNLTTFYDKTKIAELSTIVDWHAVKASYWGGQENLNVKRKKQAEFLVLNDLPPDVLIGFGCYNDGAKQRLINLGVEEEKIKVIFNAYY